MFLPYKANFPGSGGFSISILMCLFKRVGLLKRTIAFIIHFNIDVKDLSVHDLNLEFYFKICIFILFVIYWLGFRY